MLLLCLNNEMAIWNMHSKQQGGKSGSGEDRACCRCATVCSAAVVSMQWNEQVKCRNNQNPSRTILRSHFLFQCCVALKRLKFQAEEAKVHCWRLLTETLQIRCNSIKTILCKIHFGLLAVFIYNFAWMIWVDNRYRFVAKSPITSQRSMQGEMLN